MSQRRPRAVHMLARLSLAAAALVSLFTLRALQPTTTGAAILLGLWLLFPYVILAVVLETRASASAEIAAAVTALLVVAGGVAFLMLVVFIDPDPQSGIAVMLTPLYQAVATAVLLPVTRWLFPRSARTVAHEDASPENSR